MSHDSGFRRGGRDFTHKPSGRVQGPKNRTRRYERNAEKRFHQHEQDRTTEIDKDTNES